MFLDSGIIPVAGLTFLLFAVFAIAAIGYALGRVTVKGVCLGTAGVFIIAILFGCFFYDRLGTATSGYTSNALKIVENIGLALFVTAVGFIAGPKFFGNLKKNFKSYVSLGLIIILAGAIAAVSCIYIGRAINGDKANEYSEAVITDVVAEIREEMPELSDEEARELAVQALAAKEAESNGEYTVPTNNDETTAMVVGLLSGSLTSTPAFSAAKATVATDLEDIVSVGHGIAYIFGVIGVVLFVQLIPKMQKADMAAERAKLVQVAEGEKKKYTGKLIHMDEFGFMPFALATALGIVIGSIKIPLSGQGFSGTCFSLGTTGGCLLVSLIFGHFNHVGPVSVMPKEGTLKVFRELGLMLFLIGAGIAGGAKFVSQFSITYFLYGVWMTILPMVVGYLIAKYLMKLSLLNNLGSITGGMTSTPALGTLISVAGTEDVASAYAATYPVALIAVVLVSQFLVILF